MSVVTQGRRGVAAVVVVEVLWVLVSDAPIGRDATANADGVATSALEIQQNACRDSWSLEQSPEWAFISIASPALRGDAGLVFESE